MSNLVIYHQIKPGVDCPDGLASAWVLSQMFAERADYLGWCYESPEPPKVNDYAQIFVVDFSFPKAVLEQWAETGRHVVVIDHHKTALQELSSLSDRIRQKFDLEECGATLTWQTFFPDSEMPVFLKYLKDRDLGNFQLEETEVIHEAMSTLRYRLRDFSKAKLKMIFAWYDYLATLNKAELIDYLKPIGEPLVAPRRAQIEEIAARHQLINFKDNPDWFVPVVYLAEDGTEDRYVSDIGLKLYKKFPDAPFSACLTSHRSWSLRSDKFGNNTDVSEIAAQFGGGGHHNAAGFRQNKSE